MDLSELSVQTVGFIARAVWTKGFLCPLVGHSSLKGVDAYRIGASA